MAFKQTVICTKCGRTWPKGDQCKCGAGVKYKEYQKVGG